MALIRQANARQVARDAIVLDLGDVQRQAELIVERAKKSAAEILQSAGAERDRLLRGAADEGRKAGMEQGLAEGRATGAVEGREAALAERAGTLAALEKGWGEALSRFSARRDKLFTDARSDVLRLAAMIAERVVKRTIELDEGVVAAQLEAVLAIIARPTDLIVSIHPDDRAVAEKAVPSLTGRASSVRHVEFVEDPSLGRGSCVARTRDAKSDSGGGEIDASISTQVQRIVDSLLPGTPPAPSVPDQPPSSSGAGA
jgi:flagellar assembly protein FliH